MSERVALVVFPEVERYDHGRGHPLRPDRVRFTWDLIHATGLDALPNVSVLAGRSATDAEIELVHDAEYVAATRDAGHGVQGRWSQFGFGSPDNPIFADMHEAASWVVGSTLVAAEAVLDGGADHAFNAGGGLHHAMASRAAGFCVYDDPAVGIAWLLSRGLERVAYLDLDVHHGDGPESIFVRDPRVLTVSIHESGQTLFPGTGWTQDRGAGEAVGSKVNVPLPAGTGDRPWLRAIEEIAVPVIREFAPQVLVTQLGCDTHRTDPLANLRISTTGYREAARIVHGLAHEAAGGRWVAVGGGGYQRVTVVPRAWTIDFAEMVGAELPDEIPAVWIRSVREETGEEPPRTFSDPPEESRDVGADDAIDAAKRAILPDFGIIPER